MTHAVPDTVIWFNTLDNRLINACIGTLGDLYNNAIWIWLALGNKRVVQTASMPLDVKVRVPEGCISWGTLIMTPPLLSPDALSHLMAIGLSCTTGEG